MPKYEKVQREQCHAVTRRRNLNRRCKHRTLHSNYCWQHLKTHQGLRIMKPPRKKLYGLYTTVFIPHGSIIAKYTGKIINAKNVHNPFQLMIQEKPKKEFIDASKTNTGNARWSLDKGPKNNAKLVLDPKTKQVTLIAMRDIHPMEEVTSERKVTLPRKRKVIPDFEPIYEPE